MSQAEITPTANSSKLGAAGAIDRLEQWAESASDWINPILVKEVRQALKSWTFMATFLFLLLASWLVSVFMVLMNGVGLYYSRAGAQFFTGYIVILGFASYLIVPFLAFRSLLSERDQATYEVLSVTTLKPSQVVWGKLLTAVVQLFVYFSALTPFMAFTYLLGGIDVISIIMSLVWTTLASVGLSMITLTNSTLLKGRGWQGLQTLVTLGALLTAFGMLMGIGVSAGFFGGGSFDQWEFWLAILISLTFYIAYFVLLRQIAVAQLTFEADNRSTGIRLALFGLEMLAVFWVVSSVTLLPLVTPLHTISLNDVFEMMIALSVAVLIHVLAFGLFFVTEPDGLSRRVARGIPKRPIVRLFAAIFFPGGARGMALALILMAIPLAGAVFAAVLSATTRENTLLALFTAALYVSIYLNLACWIARRGLKNVRNFSPAHARVTAVVLAALGMVLPVIYELSVSNIFGGMYEANTVINLTNPVLVISRVGDGDNNAPLVVVMLGLVAGLLMMLNLRPMLGGVGEILAGPPVSNSNPTPPAGSSAENVPTAPAPAAELPLSIEPG